MERCAGDDTFGPVLETGLCYSFDFTLVFEECIFAVVPCALFLLLAAARIWKLWNRPAGKGRSEDGWVRSTPGGALLVLGLKLVSRYITSCA